MFAENCIEMGWANTQTISFHESKELSGVKSYCTIFYSLFNTHKYSQIIYFVGDKRGIKSTRNSGFYSPLFLDPADDLEIKTDFERRLKSSTTWWSKWTSSYLLLCSLYIFDIGSVDLIGDFRRRKSPLFGDFWRRKCLKKAQLKQDLTVADISINK